MSSKMALKDAGRVLGYEHAYLNELTNTIPTFNGKNMDLKDTLEEIPEIIEANKANPELFELAIDIQGIPRSQSVHASGVIVAPQELDVTIPLGMSKGTTVTQYDGDTLEDLGYFKFDILGIKYLSVIRIALELIKERHDKDIDIYKVDMNDPQVYKMIQRGETEGIFQLASSGMTEVFTGLSHLNFEDLSIGIALYRPGSMDNIPEYQDRKNGLKPVTYPHSDLESILEETQGILVYQEQLMAMAQVLGGYSQGESDNLRKATGLNACVLAPQGSNSLWRLILKLLGSPKAYLPIRSRKAETSSRIF